MSNGEPTATMIGNLTADPRTAVHLERHGRGDDDGRAYPPPRIKRGDEWIDGTTLFLRIEV